MPDENGDTLPGELGGGGYAAFEGDLGEKLIHFAGFGRDLQDPYEANDLPWDEEEEESVTATGFPSIPVVVTYRITQ